MKNKIIFQDDMVFLFFKFCLMKKLLIIKLIKIFLIKILITTNKKSYEKK